MANRPQSLYTPFYNTKSGLPETIDEKDLGKAIRSSRVPSTHPRAQTTTPGNWKPGPGYDWRVKLSLPSSGAYKIKEGESADSYLLSELIKTDGFVFPYTPQVFITHSASYDKLSPTHSNYPFPIYENSAVDQFTITGDFTVENEAEGRYWIAANHYLRSVTKMSYGRSTTDAGAPPPVVKLNGYGDFVFPNVPVVIESYQLTLPQEVDYIKVNIGENGSWVPTQSNIAVSLHVAFSRDKVNRFSLDKFVKGDYVTGTSKPGYI